MTVWHSSKREKEPNIAFWNIYGSRLSLLSVLVSGNSSLTSDESELPAVKVSSLKLRSVFRCEPSPFWIHAPPSGPHRTSLHPHRALIVLSLHACCSLLVLRLLLLPQTKNVQYSLHWLIKAWNHSTGIQTTLTFHLWPQPWSFIFHVLKPILLLHPTSAKWVKCLYNHYSSSVFQSEIYSVSSYW